MIIKIWSIIVGFFSNDDDLFILDFVGFHQAIFEFIEIALNSATYYPLRLLDDTNEYRARSKNRRVAYLDWP